MEKLLHSLRAAAEPTRLRILALCGHSDLSVTELVSILGQSQPRVSRHLKLLVDGGLLSRNQEGSRAFYRPADSGLGAELVRLLIDLIPHADEVSAVDLSRLEIIKAKRARQAKDYFRRHAGHWEDLRGLYVDDELVDGQLEKIIKSQPVGELLDIGTGSGILAILSAKLGAQKIVALDTDPIAVERALENSSMNSVEDVIEIAEGTLPLANQDFLGIDRERWAAGTFDIVVANILAHVIAELAPAIMTALKPNGVAICSGIITDGFSHALTALTEHGATLVDATSQGDWRALIVTKDS